MALPASVFRWIYNNALTALDTACSQLLNNGALFFAMRSCEYTKVHGQRRMKLLCLRNIRFFLNGHLLSHDNTSLSLADCVSITFEFQKTDIRDETITHHRAPKTYTSA
jgi:hypothetical protein